MTSLVWDNKLNPRVEIMMIQRNIITECLTTIRHEIDDFRQNHDPVKLNDLLDQLEQLCKMNFMYEELLVEELDYQSVSKHKHLHKLFVEAIDKFKVYFNKSYSPFILTNFFELKMAFVTCITNETALFSSLLDHYSRADTTVAAH